MGHEKFEPKIKDDKENKEAYPYDVEKKFWQIRALCIGLLKQEFNNEQKNGEHEEEVFEEDKREFGANNQGRKLIRLSYEVDEPSNGSTF
jgi:hypothetical protein